jgi:hypothetical protein
VCGVIALTRINGLPVAIGSICILLIFYHQAWKKILAAAGIFILLLVAMYGPGYSRLQVKHVPEFGTSLFLHHIAAHLEEGTPLSSDQADFLNKLAPIGEWDYNCCQINPTLLAIFPGAYQQNYYLPALEQDISRPARVAFDLFRKDPFVDLKHMTCAGQLVWNLYSTCPDRSRISIENSKIYSSDNAVIQGMVSIAIGFLLWNSDSTFHNINLIPVIYLLLAIYATMIISIRLKDWHYLFFVMPAVIQSAVLFLINISQTYRYQYGVILVGLFSIGLIFKAIYSQKPQNHSHTS